VTLRFDTETHPVRQIQTWLCKQLRVGMNYATAGMSATTRSTMEVGQGEKPHGGWCDSPEPCPGHCVRNPEMPAALPAWLVRRKACEGRASARRHVPVDLEEGKGQESSGSSRGVIPCNE